jgi:hypothetical protein
MKQPDTGGAWTFLHLEHPTKWKRVPRWLLTQVVHAGVIYAPAALGPDGEQAAVLGACYDGVSLVQHRGHCFLPLDWLEKEYPSWADVYSTMRRRVAAALMQENRR